MLLNDRNVAFFDGAHVFGGEVLRESVQQLGKKLDSIEFWGREVRVGKQLDVLLDEVIDESGLEAEPVGVLLENVEELEEVFVSGKNEAVEELVVFG